MPKIQNPTPPVTPVIRPASKRYIAIRDAETYTVDSIGTYVYGDTMLANTVFYGNPAKGGDSISIFPARGNKYGRLILSSEVSEVVEVKPAKSKFSGATGSTILPTTPATPTTPSTATKVALMIPPIAGIGAGLYYAKTKNGTFWEYVGYAILGNMVGHSISKPFKPTTGLKINGKDVTLPFVVKVIPAIGFIGGVAYAVKGNKSFWGHLGFGILGAIIGGIVSMPFAMAFSKPVAPATKPDAGKGTDADPKLGGLPPNDTKRAYDKAVEVGKKMGGDPANMPSYADFVKKYTSLDATEKKIFNEYMASAGKIDYADIDKAFEAMAKIGNDLTVRYGEEKVKKVLS